MKGGDSMNLSKNFTLEEMIHTDTGLPNWANQDEIEKLKWLAENILQTIRDALGPIKINSAFRSEQVNEAVGGVETSQHRLAEAADIEPLGKTLEEAYDWIRHNISFGQLIMEHKGSDRWIHVSRPRADKPNMMCLRYENGKYTTVT